VLSGVAMVFFKKSAKKGTKRDIVSVLYDIFSIALIFVAFFAVARGDGSNLVDPALALAIVLLLTLFHMLEKRFERKRDELEIADSTERKATK
jgi:hypothetical protein